MEITYKNQTYKFPDFLIAGTARSGTSSLYFYLRAHPEIFMPEFKEPHFFNFIGKFSPHPDRPPWTLKEYANLFLPAKDNQIIGEASASYLYYYEETLRSMKKYYGNQYRNVKILLILRNPIERAWSYYNLRRRKGFNEDFFQTVASLENRGKEKDFHDFIRSGMYAEQIEVFIKEFPNLKIILFEELTQKTEEVLKEIFSFLGVRDRNFLPENVSKVYNVSGNPKKKIYKPVYTMLFQKNIFKEFFKPFIPYSLRQNIKTSISKKIVEKEQLPNDVKGYLLDLFRPSLLSLLTIIQEPRKREIINSWLST